MTSLNCGLPLRKPGESAYSAYRRFLWVNTGLPVSTLRSTMLEILTRTEPSAAADTSTGRHEPIARSPLSTAALARSVERLTCSALNLPTFNTPPIDNANPLTCIQKNCAACSASLFHATPFDLPWLTHCPLHQQPLTENCPACRQPWPTAAQLPQRRCALCGTGGSFADLRHAAAFQVHPGMPSLEKLAIALDDYQRQPTRLVHSMTGELMAAGEAYPALPSHVLLQLDELDRSDPLIQDILSDYAPRVLNIRQPLKPCRQQLNELHLRASHPSPPWLPRLHTQILRKVTRTIARYAPHKHALHLVPKTSAILESSRCAYCIAFSMWYDLIIHQTDYRRLHSELLGYEMFMPSIGLPAPPQIFQEIVYQRRAYRLPASVQRILYYLELWIRFCGIYCYVSRYLNALRRSQKPPLNELWVEDCRSSSVSKVLMSIHERGALHLTIPKSLFTFVPTAGTPCRRSAPARATGLSAAEIERFVLLTGQEPRPVMPHRQ